MGRQLYARFPVFRNTIDELDAYHEELSGGTSLIRDIGLFGDAKPSASMPTPWPIAVILPSLAMIQIALFDLLSSFGLRPDILMGHSAGETSLLYASGAASKRVALEVAYVRGREMTVVENANGGMAALSCATFQADEIIALAKASAGEGVLDIACYNGPQAVAIAGELEAWRRTPHDEYDAYLDEYLVFGNIAKASNSIVDGLQELVDQFDKSDSRLLEMYEQKQLYWQAL